MDLTTSYQAVLPPEVLSKYAFSEIRQAAAIIAGTNPCVLRDLVEILKNFQLTRDDVILPGGNKSRVAKRLDAEFRQRGWREAKFEQRTVSVLRVAPYRAAGERKAQETSTDTITGSHSVDNLKERVAVEVEWNAKEGHLDRDLAAFRAFYDLGKVDAGVIICRRYDDIRALAIELGRAKGFNTTTTTTIDKLEPRLARGDAGGCPVLAVAITRNCYVP